MSAPSTTAAPVPETVTPETDDARVWFTQEPSNAALFGALQAHVPAELARSLESRLTQSEARERVLREVWDYLAEMVKNMPDLRITYADDPDTEDDIGMIPVGWNLRCNSVCVEPLTINAPTLIEAVSIARATLDQTKQP